MSTSKPTFLKLVQGWFDTELQPKNADMSKDPEKWHWPVPFVALNLGCLAVFWTGWSWTAVGVAAALYVIRMFGITGFYHRYFSHRTFRTSRAFQFVMAVVGNSAAQRGPLWWGAHHRHHHKHSDLPTDTHSPVTGTFWNSHLLWWSRTKNIATRHELITDLNKYPELRFLDRFDGLVPTLLAVSMFLLGAALERWAPGLGTTGPQMLVWGFCISTAVLFHGVATINSLSHVYGRRRYKTTDDSRNNPILALITLGEGWHNNHHHYQYSARNGFFWWEIDITYYGLKALSWLGLVWDLKPVPDRIKYGTAQKADEARKAEADSVKPSREREEPAHAPASRPARPAHVAGLMPGLPAARPMAPAKGHAKPA
jgi:stearoyl-CoA desaturase (delta-9 desaturase)